MNVLTDGGDVEKRFEKIEESIRLQETAFKAVKHLPISESPELEKLHMIIKNYNFIL